jgi:radical SAM protein with 4Fe4S-binding SPASM domain
LIFAIDGATQEVQAKYRVGSDLNRILNNVKLLVSARKKSPSKSPKEIIIQTVVSRLNESQIPILTKIAEELGVDKMVFKTLAVSFGNEYVRGKEYQESFLPENKKYWRKNAKNILCEALWEPVILHNGDVSVCRCDYEGKIIIGNIFQAGSFEAVVYSQKYAEVREKIIKRSLPICEHCPVTDMLWIPEISRSFV